MIGFLSETSWPTIAFWSILGVVFIAALWADIHEDRDR